MCEALLGDRRAALAGLTAAELLVATTRLGPAAAGAALTLALQRVGFVVRSLPGEAVACIRGDETIEPFVVAVRVSQCELRPEEWNERCTALGIGSLPLGPAASPGEAAAEPA